METLYTILIPHHNAPELLRRCLESIPRRGDLQVVVVDDCSDEDCKWVNDYKDCWGETVLVENKVRRGAGHARNVGMEYIKGRYVIFADCDDFFSEGFDAILDKYKDTDADLVYYNAKSVYSNQIEKEANRSDHLQKYIQHYIDSGDITELRYRFTEPWCKIVSMRLIRENHIDFEETIVANDYFFSVKTGYFASKIEVEPSVGYVVTLSPDSLSESTQTVESIIVRIGVSRRVYRFYKEHGVKFKEPFLGKLLYRLLSRDPKSFFKIFVNMLSRGEFGQLHLFFEYIRTNKLSAATKHQPK